MLTNEWGGGHQLKDIGREEGSTEKTQIVSSEEKMLEKDEKRDGQHALTKDTEKNNNHIGMEEALSSSESHFEAGKSEGRGLQKGDKSHMSGTNAEMRTDDQLVLTKQTDMLNRDSGMEEALSSLDTNFQKDATETTLDESPMSDTKAEMADGQLTQTEDTDVDDMKYTLSGTTAEVADGQLTRTENTDVENRGNLRKRGVEADKKKTRGVKRRRQSVNSNSETKERKREIRKKAKKLQKVQGKGKRKRSKKYLENENLQLKLEIAKLKAQSKKKIKRVKKRKRVIKGQGKEPQGNKVRTNCGGVSSRDPECSEKWATFTSVSLGLAPTVIKQVDKNTCTFLPDSNLQVNSILASDRTLRRKKSKKDDFLEHQRILQQALAANPCDGGNTNGKPPPPCLPDNMCFQICLRP